MKKEVETIFKKLTMKERDLLLTMEHEAWHTGFDSGRKATLALLKFWIKDQRRKK